MSQRNHRSGQRGAALVVVVIVTAILTVLGLSMATFSEIEEKTASAHRDEVQVQALAEAGARVVQQMFRNPSGPLVPQHLTTPPEAPAQIDYLDQTTLDNIGWFRTTRGPIGTVYTGTSNIFFQAPFRDSFDRVFGGIYNPPAGVDNYDIRLTCAGVPANQCWLNTRINALLTPAGGNWNTNLGRITEISLYAPPVHLPAGWVPGDPGRMLAYATARITAQKFDDATPARVVASETLQVIIGDDKRKPSLLANGDLKIQSSSGFCGSECEQMHANGNITLGSSGNYSGGNPVISATGSVTTNGANVTPPPQANQPVIPPPPINPWDTLYRPPAASSSINKYYLMTNRTLLAAWTDDDNTNNPPDVTCGTSTCQDYGLEAQARNVGAGCLYKWQQGPPRKWVLQGTCKANGQLFPFPFDRFRYFHHQADTTVTGAGDDAQPPFAKTKLPGTYYKIDSSLQPGYGDILHGTVLLADGGIWVGSSTGGSQNALSQPPPPWVASLIATGTIYVSSSTNMNPALPNRVMFLAGRDLFMESSFNNDFAGVFCTPPANGPAPPSSTDLSAAVIAAHEQVVLMSSGKFIGIIVAENKVNFDNNRDLGGHKSPNSTPSPISSAAFYADSAMNHGYKCDVPPWPFPEIGMARILASGDAVQ